MVEKSDNRAQIQRGGWVSRGSTKSSYFTFSLFWSLPLGKSFSDWCWTISDTNSSIIHWKVWYLWVLIIGDVLSPPQKQRFQVKTLTAKISFPLDIQKMLRMKMPWMMNLNSSILTAQLHSDMSWQLDCKQLLEKSNISFPLVLFTTWIFAGKGLNIRPCLKVSSSSQGVYKSNLTSFSLILTKIWLLLRAICN